MLMATLGGFFVHCSNDFIIATIDYHQDDVGNEVFVCCRAHLESVQVIIRLKFSLKH